jgi:hypothetical protein
VKRTLDLPADLVAEVEAAGGSYRYPCPWERLLRKGLQALRVQERRKPQNARRQARHRARQRAGSIPAMK